MRTPYIMNWSGGFQYEFAQNWLVETRYDGSGGVGLLNNWNINVIPLDVSKDPAELLRIFNAVQNYKPYPQFGDVNHFSNYGHTTYHAGTVRLEKRYSAGLTLTGSYTFAKALNESDDDGGASGITFYNRAQEKGRANFDIRHQYRSVLTYEFPFGKGRRWLNQGVLSKVLGGLDVAWIWVAESGQARTVSFSGSPNRYLPGASRPHALVPMEEAVTQNWDIGPDRFPTSAQNPYLRFDAFAYPAAFTPGTLGRNTFEGPGMNYNQIALMRTFSFGERFRFLLKAEANNLPFKAPNLTPPNATYNRNSPDTFGRFTGARHHSAIGSARGHILLTARIEF
jgi:hypothetical protein